MELKGVKGITIPNGNVKAISVNGQVLWHKGRLPYEYQEVEYIQSDGEQYIDTGVGGAIDNIAVDCKFYTETSNYNYMYGQDQNDQSMSYNGLYRNTKLEIMYKEITFAGARLIEMSQTIVGNSMNIVINGVSYSRSVGKSETSKNMLIFACFNSIGAVRYYTGNTKCYYFVIKDGDTVLRKLIPCYHKQTGVIGMFDLIGNEFYANAGTGEFTKGDDV